MAIMGSRDTMLHQIFAQMQALQEEYDFLIERTDVRYENHGMIIAPSGLHVPDQTFVRVEMEFIGIPKPQPKKGGESK